MKEHIAGVTIDNRQVCFGMKERMISACCECRCCPHFSLCTSRPDSNSKWHTCFSQDRVKHLYQGEPVLCIKDLTCPEGPGCIRLHALDGPLLGHMPAGCKTAFTCHTTLGWVVETGPDKVCADKSSAHVLVQTQLPALVLDQLPSSLQQVVDQGVSQWEDQLRGHLQHLVSSATTQVASLRCRVSGAEVTPDEVHLMPVYTYNELVCEVRPWLYPVCAQVAAARRLVTLEAGSQEYKQVSQKRTRIMSKVPGASMSVAYTRKGMHSHLPLMAADFWHAHHHIPPTYILCCRLPSLWWASTSGVRSSWSYT
jgi:hypothetical protein